MPASLPTPSPIGPALPAPQRALPRWEHFDHGADIGVRGWAPTKAGAFEQAAQALAAVITAPGQVRPAVAVALSCRAADDEALLVAWLNALVYEMATRRMLFSKFEVSIADHRLHARARGEPLDITRHQPAVEVKGATWTALRVAPSQGGWLAQVVVDV
jgi:tRNA nucleotidyltransferase (CCA-adding enzyme)